MWHHFSGKQLHTAHNLLVRNHSARVEPTDHSAHAELLLEALEAFHTSVRRVKDGHDFTHLLVGHATHPLKHVSQASLRKRTGRRVDGGNRLQEVLNTRLQLFPYLFPAFSNV